MLLTSTDVEPKSLAKPSWLCGAAPSGTSPVFSGVEAEITYARAKITALGKPENYMS